MFQVRPLRLVFGATMVMAMASVAVHADAPGTTDPSSPLKILRAPMTTDGPKSLDPVIGSTTYENRACSQIYETLVQYKYLKRPLELEPLLLEKMPEVSPDGRTWRFTLRRDVRFQDDPCFAGGVGRALVADDVIYSWKRIADPRYQHKSWWLVKDTIVGFDAYKEEQSARVAAGQPFDYDAPVPGMRVLGPHEFEIELVQPVQQFMWRLAMFQFSIVPREAVEYYGERFNRHPVGTGPFLLRRESDWVLGKSLTLHRNPNYHADTYPTEYMPEDEAAGLHEPAGQTVPFVDRIEFTFYVQENPMWLEFKAGNLDFTTVPEFGFDEAFLPRTLELKRSWARKGIVAHRVPLLDFIFRGFNMEDPVVGGYTPERRALRQAFNLATDLDEINEAFYNGTCVNYDGPIPPGLDGYPEGGRAPVSYRGPDLERARAKLREAGYTVVDGRVVDLPVIDFYTSTSDTSVKLTELFMRQLSAVGIRLNPRYVDFSTLIQYVDNKKAPMFSFAWGSDYPDAENNLALFYGPNEAPGSNHFNYKNPEYDRLYEQIRTMPPGPERTAIYERMRDMLIEDAPFVGSMARTRSYLLQPWLKNFKPTEDFYTYFKYLDVDMSHPSRPGS